MSRDINFSDATTAVTAEWLNDSQEINTGLSWGMRLRRDSTNQVTLYGDALTEGAYAVRIGAKTRYGASTVSATATGSAGGYDVYVTSDDVASPKSATLEINNGTPTSDFYRKVGTATWSGSTITSLRLLNGVQASADQYNAFVLRPLVPSDVPLTVQGASSQTGNLLDVKLSTGGSLLSVTTNGISIGSAATGGIAFSNGASIATSSGTYTGTVSLCVRAKTLEVGNNTAQSAILLYKPDGTSATITINNSNQLVVTG
jgi:hypothetical protein